MGLISVEAAKGKDLDRLAESLFGLRRVRFETDRSLRKRCRGAFEALTFGRPVPKQPWWVQLLRWLFRR